ncbi:MAG: TatD DNase family protein [Bradymonadia bacterium]
MTTRPIDTHVHLDEIEGVDLDRTPYRAALIPGIKAAKTSLTLSRWQHHESLHFAAGAHPWYLPTASPPQTSSTLAASGPAIVRHGTGTDAAHLLDLWDNDRVCAVGEIGLDHLRHESMEERAHAAAWCAWQLDEAAVRGLPLVLHVVRAHEDMLAMLRQRGTLSGFVHAFGGSLEQARQYHELGFAVGLGPAVTRDRATRVRRVAADIPSSGYVLETDAPFMAVSPAERGCGNPEGILSVASTVAALRGVSVGQVVDESTQNAIDRVPSLLSGHRQA